MTCSIQLAKGCVPAAATCRPARAVHFDAQFAHILADPRSSLHDRLMHLALHLFQNGRRDLIDDLHHVRTQITRGGVDDLKFFLDADGEAVSHSWPSGWLASTVASLR